MLGNTRILYFIKNINEGGCKKINSMLLIIIINKELL